jgi:hypothetical protein
MSGIEIVGLAVGVLPALLQVVIGFRQTKETFQSFLSFPAAVRRLQARVQTQESLFRNECRHMLRLVVDDTSMAEMVQDPGHRLWDDGAVEEQLQSSLGDSYEALQGNLDGIKDMLYQVQEQLNEYVEKLPMRGSRVGFPCPKSTDFN